MDMDIYGFGLFFKLKFHFFLINQIKKTRSDRASTEQRNSFLHPIQSNWTGGGGGWIMDLNLSDWR
jgi:hypothetical protein